MERCIETSSANNCVVFSVCRDCVYTVLNGPLDAVMDRIHIIFDECFEITGSRRQSFTGDRDRSTIQLLKIFPPRVSQRHPHKVTEYGEFAWIFRCIEFENIGFNVRLHYDCWWGDTYADDGCRDHILIGDWECRRREPGDRWRGCMPDSWACLSESRIHHLSHCGAIARVSTIIASMLPFVDDCCAELLMSLNQSLRYGGMRSAFLFCSLYEEYI